MNSSCTPPGKESADPLRQTGASLRQAKRFPPAPFSLNLAGGRSVQITRLLRVLPGKRITGEGWLGDRRVLVKLFISRNSLHHQRREQAGINALREAKLPTPEWVAASQIDEGGYALLTDFLNPSETLEAVRLSPTAGDGEKEELLRSAFHLLGRLHDAGLAHRDLHLGNFLVYRKTLYLIDAGAVKIRRPGRLLCGSAALCNIAGLLSQLPEETPCEPLLSAYQEGNPRYTPDRNRVQKSVARIRTKMQKKFLKKSMRDSTPFAVKKTFGRFTSVVRERQTGLAPLLADPDRAVHDGMRLKTGGSSTVAKVETSAGPVVIKRYNLKSRKHAFSRLWRPSRAWRSWKTGLRLQYLTLPTPEPLALIEERLGPLRRRAWLITTFCPGEHLLNHLNPDCDPPAAEREAILSLFNTLYRERISHGDLKATNLLWHEGRLQIIDLDAAKKHRSAASHRSAWKKDRNRLLRNWPDGCALHRWLDAHLPDAGR